MAAGKKKYLVIDAGGDRFTVEAAAVDDNTDGSGRRTVTFYEDAAKERPCGAYSSPTSWGPAPDPK